MYYSWRANLASFLSHDGAFECKKSLVGSHFRVQPLHMGIIQQHSVNVWLLDTYGDFCNETITIIYLDEAIQQEND